MTGAELKTIREGIGLSAQALADILGLKTDRAVRYWEAGRPVPEDVAQRVLSMDQAIDRTASKWASSVKGDVKTFWRYERDEDYVEAHPTEARAHRHARILHNAALGRLFRLCPGRIRILSKPDR